MALSISDIALKKKIMIINRCNMQTWYHLKYLTLGINISNITFFRFMIFSNSISRKFILATSQDCILSCSRTNFKTPMDSSNIEKTFPMNRNLSFKKSHDRVVYTWYHENYFMFRSFQGLKYASYACADAAVDLTPPKRCDASWMNTCKQTFCNLIL